MKKPILLLIVLFQWLQMFSQIDEFTLISWNIKDFGKSKNMIELEQMADLLKPADIIAVQEVVSGFGGPQAVARLTQILNRGGNQWDYAISPPTKSSKYMTERYAYIWKNEKLKIKNKGYLINELKTPIEREPFLINFYVGDKKLTLINFHSRPFNKNPQDEIYALNNFVINHLSDNVLIVGDFNVNEQNPIFIPLKDHNYRNVLNNQKTTLKKSCSNGSHLNHAIDNIFYSKNIFKINGGIIDFVKSCDQLKEVRKLSDHLPVYLRFSFN